MTRDGADLKRLTSTARADVEPDWSPDGAGLAFASFRNGRPDIYSMKTDGSDVQRLTDNPAADYHASWTPEGSIVFHSSRDGNGEIYSMRADGSDPRNLTRHLANDLLPRSCVLHGPSNAETL